MGLPTRPLSECERESGEMTMNTIALQEHFSDRAHRWTSQYRTHESFRARLGIVGAIIERELAAVPSARVLDFGGGTGLFSELAAQQASSVVCVDRSLPMLRNGREHRHESATILETAGFGRPPGRVWHVGGDERSVANGRFDVILAISVLEYIPDVAGVLGRLSALLAPGGCVILTVPNPRSSLRWAQRLLRPVTTSRFVNPGPVMDQAFQTLRPHGDHVPWRPSAEAVGLRATQIVPVPYGTTGPRSAVKPSVLAILRE